MPAVTLLGSTCTGHGSFPPRPNIGASPTVFANGKPIVRKGDPWAVHCDPHPSCHSGNTSGCSATVNADGKGIMRVGDAVNCGSKSASGSGNVNSN